MMTTTKEGLDLTYSYNTPTGPLLFRESSIIKLSKNDTSKYEESLKDLIDEYKDFAKKSDLVRSTKYKFKKYISNSKKVYNFNSTNKIWWFFNKDLQLLTYIFNYELIRFIL